MDIPPVLVPEVLRDGTRLTQRWAHGPINEYMYGMNGHVVVGSYGEEVGINWRVENRSFASRTLRRGFTLIPDGVDGRWEFGGGVTVSHVYLPRERMQAYADQVAGAKPVELLVRVGHEDPVTASVLEVLSQAEVQAEAAYRLFVEQVIDFLCLHLIRHHSTLGESVARPPRGGLAGWQIKRVTEFMRAHLDRDVGLAELAALINLSRYHFCTAFRVSTGYSPYHWLTRERIARARQLLAMPALSIADVALTVGYETPSAFAAAFRRITGMTPSAYRRRP